MKEDYCKVNNMEALFIALNNKESHIIIQDGFRKEFVEHTQLPLTDTELLGFEMGFRGMAGIWSEVFYQIINAFSKGSKQQKKIDSKIRKYKLKKMNENEILLYLRQLDY